MSEYNSEFTGPEIDERLKMAEAAYADHAKHSADGNIHTTADEKALWNSASESAAINRSAAGMQKKNLLKNRFPSGYTETISGVTFKVNSDGSVTANGTATANIYLVINESFHVENGSDLILSGCPEGGGRGYPYCILAAYASSAPVEKAWDEGEGTDLSAVGSSYLDFKIFIGPYVTCDNLTFRPMLRYSEVADSTYEPYTPSLQEQISALKNDVDRNTDDLAEYALSNEDAHYDLGLKISENSVLGALLHTATGKTAKNLLKNTASTTEKNGITFTINEDGSITASGTATATSALDIGKITLTAGEKYTLSGCPEGGDELTYSLYGLNTTSWVGLGGRDTGDGYTFTATAGEVVIRVNINQGTTVDNLTFYPMLRYAAIEDAAYETYTPSLLERIEALEGHIASLTGGTG